MSLMLPHPLLQTMETETAIQYARVVWHTRKPDSWQLLDVFSRVIEALPPQQRARLAEEIFRLNHPEKTRAQLDKEAMGLE